MYPRCKKDVHEIGEKFCGEHERQFENLKEKGLKGVGAGALAVGGLVVKRVVEEIPDIIKKWK